MLSGGRHHHIELVHGRSRFVCLVVFGLITLCQVTVTQTAPLKLSKPMVGLAGGIGAGKSTVAHIFEALGAAVIDSDDLVHEQYGDPVVQDMLRQWWGDRVILADQCTVDRKAIATIVFENPAELAKLQDYIYPRIENRRCELTAVYESDPAVKAIVLDSPKLFEAGLHKVCDAVVFVEADRATRVNRVIADRGWTDDELTRREKLLEPLDKTKSLADYTVINHATCDDLQHQVERIFFSVLTSFS